MLRMRHVATGLSTLALAGLLFSRAALATDRDYVDVQLVLAVDVSNSMDYDEQLVQREGYVAAFRHPEVINTIGSGAFGRIAVTYVEWGGSFYQTVVVPWRIISDVEDSLAFAAELEASPITQSRRTSISGGLLFSADLFAASDVTGIRQTIDVSGDGANNDGFPVAATRDILVERGVTINGLPITIRPSNIGGYGPLELDVYYEDCVIGGPGSFMITVDDAESFELAIRRKLVLEIAGLTPTFMQAAAAIQTPPRMNCLIGEWSRGLR
jgi:hypothetical protein